MTRLAKVVAVVLVCGGIAGGAARARAQMCGRSVAARVNQAGLEFVAQQVRKVIPAQFEIPDVDTVLVDWPATSQDMRVQIKGLSAELGVKEVRLYAEGSALHAALRIDVTSAGPVRVDNPYVGFGTADCRADLALKDLSVNIGAQITSLGGLKVEITDAEVSFDNDASEIALKDCFIGEALTKVVDFIRGHFLEKVYDTVEGLAQEKIPALIEEKLGETLRFSTELKGFAITAQLEGLSTDAGGLQAVAGVEVGLAPGAASPPCLAGIEVPAPQSCVGLLPKLQPQHPAMFAAGVSESLINAGLHAAWRSGLLCLDSDSLAQQKPQLGAAISGMGLVLGLPDTTQLGFAVRLVQPPRARLSERGGLTLELEGAQVKLFMTPADGPAGQVTLAADLAVSAAPAIAPVSGAVVLDLRDLAVSALQVTGQEGATLPLDPARLERFLRTVALPALQQKVAGLELSPSVLSFREYLIELTALRVGDGFIAAYLDAFEQRTTDDRTPPETTLVNGPEGLVSPQLAAIYVAGTDNETPPGLVRYAYALDGGAWTAPRFGRRIDAALAAGEHTIAIAAVDLQGNRDGSPLTLTFEVDAEPPEVQIVSAPPELVTDGEAAVRFAGRDARSPEGALSFKVELLGLPEGGGAPVVRDAQPFARGVSSARFTAIPNGVYRIRVTVQDEAGNVTSADTGFVVEHGGCSVASGAAPLALWPALLCGLVAFALRRRRR